MGADYVSALTGLASMVAQAVAHKHKIKQEKADTRADTAYDIAMENAMSLGSPSARYMSQAHDALTHNHRLDREPINYGQGLSLLGRSLPNLGGGSGNDGAGHTPEVNAALSRELPSSQLDYTLNMPKAGAPIYPGGSHPSVTGQVGAPELSEFRAPDWNALKLDDWEEE